MEFINTLWLLTRHSNVKPVEPEKITGNLAKEDTTSQELEVGAHTELNFKVFYSDFSFEDPDRHRNGSVPKRCPSTCSFFFFVQYFYL